MIVKPITVRSYAYNTVAYLFGPGRTNEHSDQHLVAAWSDHAPDPGRHPEQHTVGKLAARLDVPLKALRPNQRPDAKYLHIPIRTAPEDRQLTDAEWAVVARRVLTAGGLLTHSEDRQGPRWIAVRHAPDHIHLLVGLVRQDGRAPDLPKMYIKAMRREVDRIEADLGLRQLNPGDGTAAKHPGHQEYFKAARQQQPAESTRLRTAVRQALAASATVPQLVSYLAQDGILADVTRKPSGDIRGITFAHQPDHGQEPVWYSGSRLAPDLSLPKILSRLQAAEHFSTGHQPAIPWRNTARTLAGFPAELEQADEQQAADQIHAFGALLDAAAQSAPRALRAELRQAATVFERATRSSREADYQAGRALRELAYQLTHTTGTGDAVAWLLCTAIAAVTAISRWHTARHHHQQTAACQQTLTHLRTAYREAADVPLARITATPPAPQVANRWETWLRTQVAALADRITTDPHWPALLVTLHHAGNSRTTSRTLTITDDDRKNLEQADNAAALLLWQLRDITADQITQRTQAAALARSQGAITASPSIPPAPAPPRAPSAATTRTRRR
jgi:hypothetical protein